MSKNIIALLKSMDVKDPETVAATLLKEDDAATVIQELLKQAQTYSKPFIEAELKEGFDTERKSLKGKYFQDAARQVNTGFGNKLTNSELEKIIKDPENKDNFYLAVLLAIKEKLTSTGDLAQMQEMLDKANGVISEKEKTITDMEAKHKSDFDNYVKTGKMTATLKKELVKIMTKITSMDAEAAAELLLTPLGKKALIQLNDKDGIDLFDITKPETKLKKSDTEFQTLEGLATDLAKEYKLPEVQSGGGGKEKQKQNGEFEKTEPDEQFKNTALGASDKMALAFEEAFSKA